MGTAEGHDTRAAATGGVGSHAESAHRVLLVFYILCEREGGDGDGDQGRGGHGKGAGRAEPRMFWGKCRVGACWAVYPPSCTDAHPHTLTHHCAIPGTTPHKREHRCVTQACGEVRNLGAITATRTHTNTHTQTARTHERTHARTYTREHKRWGLLPPWCHVATRTHPTVHAPVPRQPPRRRAA